MSDSENEEDNAKSFCVERAKQGRATCKKCKQKCLTGELRIAKFVYNPFGSEKMKQWHHLPCLFDLFLNQRLTTKRLTDPDDVDGWNTLEENEQNEILKLIEDNEKKFKQKFGDKYTPQKLPEKKNAPTVPQQAVKKLDLSESNSSTSLATASTSTTNNKDNLFREFRRLVADITNEDSYLEKSAIIKKHLTKGSDGTGFKGDIIQWCRLLLPGVIKRIYNLQSKQLIKLFSNVFGTYREEMFKHFEQGDIGETIQYFFENSTIVKPVKKSLLTVQEVDELLDELTNLTKEDEQMEHFKKIIKKCTGNDLKLIIRLIKHDLRMNAGAKHVLDGVHPDAYELFQASRDLPSVLKRILGKDDLPITETKTLKAKIQIMTPVLPMLAEACKSIEQAMKKCPSGMYSEIKYDGERVQVHKHKSEFKYFSRSLKPVMSHKVNHFKDYIPKAFPHANDLILDSEVLLIDTTNGKPLPFGSLGVHKREEFKNANVCLFVFDCIYYNGESLIHKTMKERREILRSNMKEIPNHIMFSETEEVYKAEDLAAMITKVLKLGLEGLVLKDMNSIYEPGKRHWLKVKKDYLCDGAMADSADLIVIGAWFGTGKKGGMMSIFLMGCYDEYSDQFCTVTKVHTGHDDKTLEQLQTELDMIKISADVNKVPDWLKCNRQMVPDFVACDPRKQPVWEITGAEFTQHEVHTADGISIRFPRVTHIRHDKDWQSATTLRELKELYKKSKENTDFVLLTDEVGTSNTQTSVNKKVKNSAENGSNLEDISDADVKMKIRKEKKTKSSDKYDTKPIIQEMSDIKIDEDINSDVLQNNKINMEISRDNEMDVKENTKRKSDNCLFESNKKIKKNISSDSLLTSVKIGPNFYPQMFHNIKVIMTNEIREKYDNLVRCFFAVGGDEVDSEDVDHATHVIHSENVVQDISNWPRSVRHVSIDWLKDSIGNKEIQNVKPYTVQWLPD